MPVMHGKLCFMHALLTLVEALAEYLAHHIGHKLAFAFSGNASKVDLTVILDVLSSVSASPCPGLA